MGGTGLESSKPYIRPLGKGKTIVMMEKHSLTGAPAHMKALGQRTDDSVLDYVRGHTGATVSQIARSLRITNGRVDGSTNRLAEKGLLDVKHFLRNGKLVKRAYPRGLATRRPDIMEISPILVDTESWGDAVALYALSRSAIGISPRAYLEWEEASLYKCHAAVERQKDNVLLKIPERFVGFYELPNSEIDISGIEDKALVTIQSTIIPVDVPIGTQEEAE
jgi:hypothetical protein